MSGQIELEVKRSGLAEIGLTGIGLIANPQAESEILPPVTEDELSYRAGMRELLEGVILQADASLSHSPESQDAFDAQVRKELKDQLPGLGNFATRTAALGFYSSAVRAGQVALSGPEPS